MSVAAVKPADALIFRNWAETLWAKAAYRPGTEGGKESTMTQAQTEDLLRQYFAALASGDIDATLAYVSDAVVHDVNQGGERRVGKDRLNAYLARMAHHYRETISDLVLMITPDGSRAAAEYNVSGVYIATEDGLPPAADQTYQLPAGTFFAVANGRITRITHYYNLTDWITQITAVDL